MSFAVRGVARAAVRQRRWSCASARWSGLSKPRVAAPSTRVAWLSTVPTPGSSASASQVEEARATQALGRYGNMLLRLLGYYSEEPTRLRAADALFRSCAERASHPVFMSKGLVGNDFRSKHTLLVTHVWMVHRRLSQQPTGTGKVSDGGDEVQMKLMQEAVFDELWNDSMFRIRAIGVSARAARGELGAARTSHSASSKQVPELTVNKHLTSVQKYSFASAVSYDHALSHTDADERIDALAGALWRFVYLQNESLLVEHVLELGARARCASRLRFAAITVTRRARVARYVETNLDTLYATPTEAILEGRIAWGELPKWGVAATTAGAPAADGAVGATNADEDVDEELGEWRKALTEAGKVYWWNVRTRESRWDDPMAAAFR